MSVDCEINVSGPLKIEEQWYQFYYNQKLQNVNNSILEQKLINHFAL
jgi:hypothetical protein